MSSDPLYVPEDTSIWAAPKAWIGRWDYSRELKAWTELRDRLEAIKDEGKTINFCSNVMLDRGSVYTCTINENGEAVIVTKHTWWSCSFSEPTTTRAGEILGKVTIERNNGCSGFHPACGKLKEGRG